MKYDLVLFDVDDTLLDFGRARDHALGSVLGRFAYGANHEAMAARFHVINTFLWKELEAARVTKEEVLEGRFRRLFSEFSVSGAAGEANEHFLVSLADKPFLIDGAVDLLESLSIKRPLGIISNGHGPTQRKRLERAGLASHFRFALISDEVGHAKPHPLIFRRALMEAGLGDGAKVLMVGDNFEADIRGAQGVGFDTCWLSGKEMPDEGMRPTYVARSLAEVGRYLRL